MLPDDHSSGTDLVPVPSARPLQLALAADLARADEAELRAYAGNTKRAYLADLSRLRRLRGGQWPQHDRAHHPGGR